MISEAPLLAYPLFTYHLRRYDLSAAADIAQTHYQQAKDTPSGLALWAFNLGRVAQPERDFTQARSYYEQSLEILLKLGDEYGAAGSYHQLGRVAQEEGDLQTALSLYGKAFVALDSLNDPHSSGIAMRSIKSLLPELSASDTTLSQLLSQSGLSPDQIKQALDS